jgi:hypothetical protein
MLSEDGRVIIDSVGGKNAMGQKQELEKKLADIEAQILETESRMPAHSVKPPIMMALFELEEQRDEVMAQIKALNVS